MRPKHRTGMIKAAIFDLDGVIVDTARYHFLAWKRLAEELGFEFKASDNERLKGVSRMVSLEILLQVGDLSDHFNMEQKLAMAERKNVWYQEFIARMTPDEILPGVVVFLTQVRADGVRIALGSASRNAAMILDRVGIASTFDACVDGTMVSSAKPDPEVFLKGAELLSVKPPESVVFEDAVAGIEAAIRGGMKSVGVGSKDILSKADIVIDGFKDKNWLTIKNKLCNE